MMSRLFGCNAQRTPLRSWWAAVALLVWIGFQLAQIALDDDPNGKSGESISGTDPANHVNRRSRA